MGCGRSRAAEMEEDAWRSSAKYAEYVALCERYNPLMEKLLEIESGSLTIKELRVVINLPTTINPNYLNNIPRPHIVDQLESIVCDYELNH